MKHMVRGLFGALILVGASAYHVVADITIVMQPPDTVSGGNFSAFAYDPATDEFRTSGYISGHDFRWSELLDDAVAPWDIVGGQLLSNFQLEIFARDGFAGNRSSYNFWGMNFCPVDHSFFLGGIASLKGPSGAARLDAERDLVKHFPDFPDSPQVMPTNCWVSDAGGIYKLVDDNLTAGDGFLAVGVQPGHRVTLFPVDWAAQVIAKTYTITEVVSNNEVRLDDDPSFAATPPVTGVGYILSIQPHLTLGTFRQNIAHYADNLSTGPKAHYKGGMSSNGLTLYIGEAITDNVLAVDTQIPEQFTIFVSSNSVGDYVRAQIDAGRHKSIVHPYRVITDGLDGGWNDGSIDTTVDFESTEEFVVGATSAKVTFDGTTAGFALEVDDHEALDPVGFTNVNFWIHGGASGGQAMDLWLINSNGAGGAVTLAPPQAGTWTNVVIPVAQFGVADDVFRIVFENTAGAAQPAFYVDQLVIEWADPLPAWAAPFNGQKPSVGLSQIDVGAQERVWFSEGETDDIVWTADGQTLHTFLLSSTISQAYISTGAIDPNDYNNSNAVQVMGMILDPMGTLYWSDNQTKSIWKASARNPRRIIQLASKAELKEALGLGTHSPRGIHCFNIRGTQLLTFNFVNLNGIYSVDLKTHQMGDFDADFDVDRVDAAFILNCLSGPNVTQWPVSCTSSAFAKADLDEDGDVDLRDVATFEIEFTETSITPPPPVPGDLDHDGDVDVYDFFVFVDCMTGPLGPMAGDLNNDKNIDLLDYLLWQPCLTGPGAGLDPGCAGMDLNGDGSMDLVDFARLQELLPGDEYPLEPGCEDADFDGDIDVDTADAAIFQRLFIP